jgi:serine/threonine-protein kinase
MGGKFDRITSKTPCDTIACAAVEPQVRNLLGNSDEPYEPTQATDLEDRTVANHEPMRLPAAPGVSRVDTLSEDFLRFLSRRPHQIGDVIANRYRLLETLGNGAMGQVFVAENVSIGRRVALKMLKPELLADAQFRRRFQQEAEAIAAIEHRNVARFLDLVVGDPTFLVMEFVPGPTLAQVLRQGKLEPQRAVQIALRLCWALDAAHAAGVIHRDIKPANVVLAADAEGGPEQPEAEPKLIDFGLAKLASATSGEGLTRTGQIIGTPQYMSPEQVSNREVDARSDVYSLGCVLFEMLTATTPFGGSDDIQVLYQQIQGTAEPPSKRAPGLPRALDQVVARCLAKAPRERFGSMREMAEALAQLDRGHGRRRPAAARAQVSVGWALALGVAGALAGGGGVWLGSQGARSAATILVTSQPSGAAVDVDGHRWRETTPTAVTALGPGAHEVRLSVPGYGNVTQTVTLQRDGRASLTALLPPEERVLTVQTVPASARVFVDGRLEHKRTPATIHVGDGDFHELRFELDGYEVETRALKPEDHAATLTVQLEPQRQERGSLWVDAPTAAQVFIDGAPSGAVVPTVAIPVAVGAHLIEARAEDGTILAQRKITIRRGDVQHLSFEVSTRR